MKKLNKIRKNSNKDIKENDKKKAYYKYIAKTRNTYN